MSLDFTDVLRPSDKLAVLVDGANFHGAVRALELEVDFRRLRTFFASNARLVRLSYYTALPKEQEYSSLRPLIDWLQFNGYVAVTKTAREFTDDAGRRRSKNSVIPEMIVDAMLLAPKVDHIVFISGDGDLRYATRALQRMGVRVSVASSLQTQPPLVADDLRRQADDFIELEDLRGLVSREGAPRRPRTVGSKPAKRATEDDHEYDDDDFED